MSQPLIKLTGVRLAFDGETILDAINLDVDAGDYIGIIGPNGGGKTTLLKVMLGLLEPSKGSVQLWGVSVGEFTQWAKIGYVPQRTGQTDFRLPITVEEVVGLASDSPLATKQALRQVGLGGLAKRRLSELSGGQQQKTFIAKALASKPEVLVLDEPTVGVDVKAQDDFYQLITRLNKNGLTVIMVSHDIDVVVNEVSKLACINKKVVYHGQPQDFLKKDYMAKLYGKTRKLILHGH